MTVVLLAGVLALLLLLGIGLERLRRSRGRADALMAGQLLGTTAVAVVALLALVYQVPAFYDVALVLGLLTLVAVVTFARHRGSA